MRLPDLKLRYAPESQKKHLERWFLERELDMELRLSDADVYVGEEEDNEDVPTLVAPFADEPVLEVGQVRLLSPEFATTRDRLLYVALLEPAADGGFSVAPYSRFGSPCLPGELLTGREKALRVLCLWNAVELRFGVVCRSWFVDRLTVKELADALMVRRSLVTGTRLSGVLLGRVGPSKWHPADPRNEYETEELRVMSALVQAVGPSGTVTYPEKDISLPIAADPRDSYETEEDDPE